VRSIRAVMEDQSSDSIAVLEHRNMKDHKAMMRIIAVVIRAKDHCIRAVMNASSSDGGS
jgi:hypothetical protein